MSSPISVDYSKLYYFTDPLATRPFRLRSRLPAGTLSGDRSHLLAQGKLAFDEPIQFDAASGGHATDILWSQDPLHFCVSGRLIRLLEEHGITGWSPYPVEVYDRKGILLPDYYGFAITGGTCDQDYDRSLLIEKMRPSGKKKGKYFRGVYFNESQRDGSDMFWVGRGTRVVVDKVYKLFRKHKIRNVRFTPLSDVEVSELVFRPEP